MKRINNTKQAAQVIDANTTYIGEALEGHKGEPVRILEVRRYYWDLKGKGPMLTNDELARRGGLDPADRLIVAFVYPNGRTSADNGLKYEVGVADVAMFAHLAT